MTSSAAVPNSPIAKSIEARKSTHSSNSFSAVPISFSLFKVQNGPNLIGVYKKTHFKAHFSTQNSSHFDNPGNAAFIKRLILLAFSLALLSFRLISSILLPDFTQRWHALIAFSSQAEAKLRSERYPTYLLQAVVAYEDRCSVHHIGVDPVAVARAVVSFSNLGGGSTITQQLVKNMLLKNERTFRRKAVEMVLALMLEKKLTKLEILSTYLCKSPLPNNHGLHQENGLVVPLTSTLKVQDIWPDVRCLPGRRAIIHFLFLDAKAWKHWNPLKSTVSDSIAYPTSGHDVLNAFSDGGSCYC